MKRWLAVLGAVVFVAMAGGYYLRATGADAAAQSCDDWVRQTDERVRTARVLLYPADRPGAFQGTAQEAAGELYILFEEQQASEPPEGAGQLNDDLVEALSVAAEALAAFGGSGADVESQIVFAKAIIYNADVRLLTVFEQC